MLTVALRWRSECELGALRQPPFLAAGRADIFGPAVMDRRREILRQERREPCLAPDAPACALAEFGLRGCESLRIGQEIDQAAADGAGRGLMVGSIVAGKPPSAFHTQAGY